MESVELDSYLGECQVIEVKGKIERIKKSDLKSDITCERILFKTSFPDPYKWNDDFNALSP